MFNIGDNGNVKAPIAPAPRRTQAERTARTRGLLLDATIASLVEVGYAGTSTIEVARRAGVSRGAQTHHFPTKSDLVVAAVEHLFAGQERSFRAAFDALPTDKRTLEAAIDILWEIINGPSYVAILELVVAARTDPELSAVVQGVAAGFEQAVRTHLAELFPNFATSGVGASVVGFAFATLQGAAISESVGFFGPSAPTIELLRQLARLGVDDLVALASAPPLTASFIQSSSLPTIPGAPS